ncbi:Uncharacterised protein [uncultured archaeon]|nr:Uncharacterised protein [uncultured archaeon]
MKSELTVAVRTPHYETVDDAREAYKEPKVYCPSCCEFVEPVNDTCPNSWCRWGLR